MGIKRDVSYGEKAQASVIGQSQKKNIFYTWIPTIIGEESYKKAYGNFIRRKNDNNECLIKLESENNKVTIECEILKSIEKEISEYVIEFINSNEYLNEIIKEIIITNNNINSSKYDMIIYPKYLYDRRSDLYRDSTIIMLFDGNEYLRAIIIVNCEFHDFIKDVLKYSNSKDKKNYPFILSNDLNVGSFVYSGWDGSNSLVSFEVRMQNEVEYKDDIIAKQIYRLLCDIYFIRIFHTYQDVIVEPIKCENEDIAIDRILTMYREKIANYQEELRNFENKPFYYYLNYSKIRNAQRSIKLAFGDLIFAESFYNYFRTKQKKSNENMKVNDNNAKIKLNDNNVKTDKQDDDDLLIRIKMSQASLEILTERIESKWNFIGPLTILLSLLMLINTYFISNSNGYNQIFHLGVLTSDVVVTISGIIFVLMFMILVPVVCSLFVLYTTDIKNHIVVYIKRWRIKIPIEFDIFIIRLRAKV